MENGKKSNGTLVGVLIGLVIALLVVGGLFATGTIGFKTNTTADNGQTSENNQTGTNQSIVDISENQGEQDTNGTTLTNDEAMDIIKSIMKKSFNYIYALSPECGDRNKNDTFQENNHTYEASNSYKTQADLKTYLHTYLSDNIISSVEGNYVVDMYKEKNGKLYCLNSGKGCGWIYDDTDTNYTIGSIRSNEIKAGGNIYYETCGNEKKEKPVSFVLKKDNNNNWILDTYLSK